MINLEKLKRKSVRTSLRRPATAPHSHPLFLIFQIPPSKDWAIPEKTNMGVLVLDLKLSEEGKTILWSF